jgi:hypothetical protein
MKEDLIKVTKLSGAEEELLLKRIFAQVVSRPRVFIVESESILLCLQESVAGAYLKPYESNHASSHHVFSRSFLLLLLYIRQGVKCYLLFRFFSTNFICISFLLYTLHPDGVI